MLNDETRGLHRKSKDFINIADTFARKKERYLRDRGLHSRIWTEEQRVPRSGTEAPSGAVHLYVKVASFNTSPRPACHGHPRRDAIRCLGYVDIS